MRRRRFQPRTADDAVGRARLAPDHGAAALQLLRGRREPPPRQFPFEPLQAPAAFEEPVRPGARLQRARRRFRQHLVTLDGRIAAAMPRRHRLAAPGREPGRLRPLVEIDVDGFLARHRRHELPVLHRLARFAQRRDETLRLVRRQCAPFHREPHGARRRQYIGEPCGDRVRRREVEARARHQHHLRLARALVLRDQRRHIVAAGAEVEIMRAGRHAGIEQRRQVLAVERRAIHEHADIVELRGDAARVAEREGARFRQRRRIAAIRGGLARECRRVLRDGRDVASGRDMRQPRAHRRPRGQCAHEVVDAIHENARFHRPSQNARRASEAPPDGPLLR